MENPKCRGEPITFRDVKFIGFASSMVINGKFIRANNILQNSNGNLPVCWFATKTSDVYYYWTFGSCIFNGGRAGPVGVAPIDRNISGKPGSTNSNFKK